MTIRASGQFERKCKFRSYLKALQNRKLDNGLVTTLCTYMPRGKKYPYGICKSSKQLSISLQHAWMIQINFDSDVDLL